MLRRPWKLSALRWWCARVRMEADAKTALAVSRPISPALPGIDIRASDLYIFHT